MLANREQSTIPVLIPTLNKRPNRSCARSEGQTVSAMNSLLDPELDMNVQ